MRLNDWYYNDVHLLDFELLQLLLMAKGSKDIVANLLGRFDNDDVEKVAKVVGASIALTKLEMAEPLNKKLDKFQIIIIDSVTKVKTKC